MFRRQRREARRRDGGELRDVRAAKISEAIEKETPKSRGGKEIIHVSTLRKGYT